MPNWLTYHHIHMAARIITGAYLTGLVGWTIYSYCKKRGPNQGSVQDKLGGDNVNSVGEVDSDSDFVEDDLSDSNYEDEDDDLLLDQENESRDIPDIEDIGPGRENLKTKLSNNVGVTKRRKLNNESEPIDYSKFTEEQITDRLRGDLTKQGYKLIETHSAVKICRWTKNSMRGRGGCYKHTFYGIKSYQCMEMTPNLACASKCTFCWRHHKNPVGTEWKWKMDAPDVIVEQGLKNHLEMVRQLKGVPGVTKERFSEAQTVRHCALSLVGEPIFYPRINELLEILHARKISTFLVTNAQFPDAMRHLVPVTQLYVSIDAPNKEALKKIDRPLYKDFWTRYIDCLKILSEKKQRTVFRLTLVQKANMEDLEGYAKLIEIGKPDFIEIKGVTYCGTSKANKLTMENVPWHEQVIEFAQELLTHLSSETYELACEHSHSNCTLIANKRFKVNGKWHTWINYEKYFELIETHKTTKVEFDSLDYAEETPSWAIFGSEEGGFDPEHMRWIRKDHKLKLLTERLAAQEKSCSIENGDCCKKQVVEATVTESVPNNVEIEQIS